jgi:hypothetical protein
MPIDSAFLGVFVVVVLILCVLAELAARRKN